MSSPKKRNLPASIKQRLLNLSEAKDIAFDLILTRYAIERLLYRLTQSSHAGGFLLKGAMLFAVWSPGAHRPTRDLDLLGFGPSDADAVKLVFQELCQVPVDDDGLAFSSESIRVEEIRADAHYGGLRVQLLALLGKVKIPVQVDIGYGDTVTPGPETVTFPPLLDFPAPTLRAYPIYTVVAEKFEAMVSLGETNTRMKDFYDVWFLCERFGFEKSILTKAITGTFERRRSPVPASVNVVAWSEPFIAAKQSVWAAFLKRNALQSPEFTVVIGQIREFIGPILEPKAGTKQWTPKFGWKT